MGLVYVEQVLDFVTLMDFVTLAVNKLTCIWHLASLDSSI